MDAERSFIEKRLSELAEQSVTENRFRFSEFLSMYERSIFHEMERELSYAEPVVFGGCEDAERCMVRFGIEDQCGYSEAFPISILEIRPAMEKYAGDLTHRDYLGSILGLGLERTKIGDIYIKDHQACVFVNESVESYILTNLMYVGRTKVKTARLSVLPESLKPVLSERSVLVSSNRIDSVIAKLYGLSRDEALRLVKNGQVFIGGRQINKNAANLQPGQIISVRGHGRFVFDGEGSKSRKDKLYVNLRVYGK
ncbi:MAG: hypothetical protein K6E18_08105 [Lachnospiraceae bacterium]|nr:hypothetical protein [Lachnospiraceae bacterium]